MEGLEHPHRPNGFECVGLEVRRDVPIHLVTWHFVVVTLLRSLELGRVLLKLFHELPVHPLLCFLAPLSPPLFDPLCWKLWSTTPHGHPTNFPTLFTIYTNITATDLPYALCDPEAMLFVGCSQLTVVVYCLLLLVGVVAAVWCKCVSCKLW